MTKTVKTSLFLLAAVALALVIAFLNSGNDLEVSAGLSASASLGAVAESAADTASEPASEASEPASN